MGEGRNGEEGKEWGGGKEWERRGGMSSDTGEPCYVIICMYSSAYLGGMEWNRMISFQFTLIEF